MARREDSNRRRALRDVLAYEDTITVDVEKTVHKIRERAKTLHAELDMYITNILNQIKHKFEQELSKIRYTVEKLKNNDLSPTRKGTSRSSSIDRSPRYRSTPRSGLDFSLHSRSTVSYADVDEMHQFDKKEIHFIEGEANDKVFERLVGHYTFETTTPITFNAIQRSIVSDNKSEVKLVKTFKVIHTTCILCSVVVLFFFSVTVLFWYVRI